MPIAIAPNAPWVEVWLSPQTTVMPGWVSPSCGPMTCTMPCSASPIGCRRTPNSAQLRRSVSTCVRDTGSAIGLSMSTVGTLWSSVAIVRSGRRTGRPGQPQAVEGLGAGDLVDEVQVDVDQVGFAVHPEATTCSSHTFSAMVLGRCWLAITFSIHGCARCSVRPCESARNLSMRDASISM